MTSPMQSRGFTLLEERTITESQSRARLWRHDRTGAELLSLCNDDENKVFGVTFRTPPRDSTGVAHILEHSVLCGSRKYPLKEPFVELLKGSLKTFLNAFTYPDKTCYPVASTNVQDFYNLMDVYLDAVFHPLIEEHIFRQEGWRLEPVPEAPERLQLKGVVYNEMKGAYSSPDGLLSEKAQQTLFPDTVYGLDSGGDPQVIPDLSYEAFLAFHRSYYHPSNARFFFHGDDPEAQRLERIATVIDAFAPLEPRSQVTLQPSFTAPKTLRFPYPVSSEEQGGEESDAADRGRCFCVLSWLFPEPPDLEAALCWDMLETMLIGLPGAPLRKALLESGLGEDLAGVGLEAELLQSYFSTGLKGLDAEDVPALEALLLETLQGLAESGFPAELVEAALNSLEFDLRENNTGSMPRGLQLMLRCLTQWLYDKNPLDALAFEAPLAAIKARLAGGERLFEGLVRQLLLDNPHRVTLVLEPDEGLAVRLQQEEEARIASLAAGLDERGRARLAAEAEELLRLQQTPDKPETLALLPRLTLGDLPRENALIPSAETDLAGAPALVHDLATSGILYLDLCFELEPLLAQRPALAPLLPLFGRALLETGTTRRDYVEMSTRIARKTGGIEADSLVYSAHDRLEPLALFTLRGKATLDKAPELCELMQELLCEADFADAERLRQLVQEELAGLEERLTPMGHRMALSRAGARHSRAATLNELLYGVNQLFFLRRLAVLVQRDPAPLQAALAVMRSLLLTREGMRCNLTLPEADLPRAAEALRSLVAGLPQAGLPAEPTELERLLGAEHCWPQGTAYALDADKEGLQISARVNFVAKAVNIHALGFAFQGAFLAGTRLLSTGWLWDRVRVQGGAYGAFCSYDRFSGTLAMASYRDPNLQATLAAFDASAEALRQMLRERSALESAVIGSVGDLDSHMLPDAKGFASLLRQLTGDTPQRRQRMREELLAASSADLEPLALALEAFARQGNVCVLAPAEALQAAADAAWRTGRLL